MQATRTSAGRADAPQPLRHQHRGSPSAPSPAGPGTRFLDLRSDEEFLSRFGDAIDDRIAEILDELLEERNATRQHRRLPQVLSTVSVILALAASVLLQHSAIAAWTIWPATAVVCLAAAWTTSNGRSLAFAGNDMHGRPGAYLSRREWTRLVFLCKPAAAGTPCLVRPDLPAPPRTAVNPEIATTLLTSRQHGLSTRHCLHEAPGHL